ncbi:MAG: transporter substrate-binding domain-containing protein [Proteobacteria bacterium]|nr:transporter substrate-binding domain-containing protein [Pseudomonadota bacterium]
MLLLHGSVASRAEDKRPAAQGHVTIPAFVDPERRIERGVGIRSGTIRFVTEEDYPPFNYIGRDGALSGFNIDLARAICAELSVTCTVQPRRWALLLPALDREEADAVIAGHRLTSDLRREYETSLPTLRSPARFAARRDRAITNIEPAALAGRRIGTIGGSAHEAYLNAFFPGIQLVRFERPEQALDQVRRGEVDFVFGDAVALGFWMNGSESLDCCAFVGGAFTESRYFGEGAAIVMRHGKIDLRNAIDHALWRINRDGRYAKIYLKHFPMPLY